MDRKTDRDRRCRAAKCPLYGQGSDLCGQCPGPLSSRNRQCHKCEWFGKGSPVCISCAGPADQLAGNGRSWVHTDGAPAKDELLEREGGMAEFADPATAIDGIGDDHPESPTTVTESLSAETEDALRIILAELAQLDNLDREYFFLVYNGANREEAGSRMGDSKQNAKNRIDRICRSHRKLGVFLRSMLTHRDGLGGGSTPGRRKGGFMQLSFDL